MECCADLFSRPKRKPVLVVLHGENSTPGRIGRLLRELGAPLDIRRPRFGDPLPTTMRDHSGAVFFGGPMSVNDEEDWLKREIDWIGAPLKENKPFLGICLGAQLLARHLGHPVGEHPEGRVEVGYYPIHPTEAGQNPSPAASINGTARASTCPAAPCCWPRATISRRRRSASATKPMGCNSTPT
jgi:GMP synthase (glutamine-hydrolysing)